MIMVIGGRCQGKSSFAKEHFENRVQEKGKTQEDHQKDPKADHWADGETSTWEEFLTSTWCRNFHLLVRRILKKDETLGLPDEQETALFETTSAGLHNWKNLAETIYNANLDRILVTDEIGYGIVPIDPFEREYREETGRICCLLAEKSEEVWRVCCGIGTRLKDTIVAASWAGPFNRQYSGLDLWGSLSFSPYDTPDGKYDKRIGEEIAKTFS